jgi:hypothetical protein
MSCRVANAHGSRASRAYDRTRRHARSRWRTKLGRRLDTRSGIDALREAVFEARSAERRSDQHGRPNNVDPTATRKLDEVVFIAVATSRLQQTGVAASCENPRGGRVQPPLGERLRHVMSGAMVQPAAQRKLCMSSRDPRRMDVLATRRARQRRTRPWLPGTTAPPIGTRTSMTSHIRQTLAAHGGVMLCGEENSS